MIINEIYRKSWSLLLAASNGVFIIMMFILWYYNRPAADDFHFLTLVRDKGIINTVFWEYHNWCTRYFAVFFYAVVLKAFLVNKFAFLCFGMLYLAINIFCWYRIVIIVESNEQQTSKFSQIQKAILIVSILFYASFSQAENWFWLSALFANQLTTTLFLLGFSYLIKPIKIWLQIPILLLIFAYIGGASEIVTLFGSLLLLLMLLFRKKIDINNRFSKFNLYFFLIAIISLIVFFVFMYKGEGNANRRAFFEHIDLLHALLLNVKMTGIIIVKKVMPTIPYLLVGAIIINDVFKKLLYSITTKLKFTHVTYSIFVYFILIYIFQLPITYITQDVGADRTLFPLVIINLIFSSIIISFIFNTIKKLNVHFVQIAKISIILLLALNIFQGFHKTHCAYQYAKAYDLRISFIQENKNTRQILKLKALPDAGFLYSAEISNDSTHFLNQHLQKYYGLKEPVVLQQY